MTELASPPADAPAAPSAPLEPRRKRPRWYRRPWMVPLLVVAVAFIGFSLPPYLTFDPANSRVPPANGLPEPFLVLVGHVVFGSVAMLTCCLQIWPWLRNRHRRVHRIAGRVYVFGGVLPAGLMGLGVGAFSPLGPSPRVSDVTLALLWLGCTFAGWRTARQRRYADHRRWMVRSFALTMSIIINRIVGVIAVIVLQPQYDTVYRGDDRLFQQAVASITTWTSWTLALLVAEWWLVERGRRTRRAGE